jgi:very-short-patch-repair endonuclease
MRRHLLTAGVDHAVAALAARQFGIVTRAQLVAAGLAPRAIDRRLSAGRLHRLHSGIYAVRHQAPSREARWMAAVLACGPGAVLSHRSAATLWRIRDGEGPRPDVTVAPSGRRHPAITIHRSQLEPQDRTVQAGIPVTTPTRTFIDLEHEVDDDDLAQALREVQYQRRFNLKEAQALLARRPSRKLTALLKDLILVQNRLEARLIKLCDRYKLPRPLTQQVVRTGQRVDFLWPDHHLIVETDGWEAHGTRTAFQADRTASNTLQLAGYTILRFTDADVEHRPTEVARQLKRALARHEHLVRAEAGPQRVGAGEVGVQRA